MTNQPPPFPVLISRDAILRRIHELARQVAADCCDGGPPPRFVAVVEGARTFARHLTRLLPGRPPFDEVRASSYGAGTVSSGTVEVGGADAMDVCGQRVVLLEDIVDTGRTIARLRGLFLERGAESVRVVSLLGKPSRREVEVPIDHLGFEIDDHFVIGFGMDVGGRYRELEEIVVYDEALERSAAR